MVLLDLSWWSNQKTHPLRPGQQKRSGSYCVGMNQRSVAINHLLLAPCFTSEICFFAALILLLNIFWWDFYQKKFFRIFLDHHWGHQLRSIKPFFSHSLAFSESSFENIALKSFEKVLIMINWVMTWWFYIAFSHFCKGFSLFLRNFSVLLLIITNMFRMISLRLKISLVLAGRIILWLQIAF